MTKTSINTPFKIAIVVGETSGDTLGAALMRALKQTLPLATFEGIGGPQMQALGFRSLYSMEHLAVMGIVEVLGRLRQLVHIRNALVAHWKNTPPDIFIGIDAPDFNLRLAPFLKQQGIKTVHYVSPSVWAWREKRVHHMKKALDAVLCLFPFEVDFYNRHQLPAYFVGHPLAEQIPLDYSISEAKQVLDLPEEATIVALLPGSRNSEVSRLITVQIDAAIELLLKKPTLIFVIPIIKPSLKPRIEEALMRIPETLKSQFKLFEDTTGAARIGRQVMAASTLVILASGTATLEAMLLGRPMISVYKLSTLTFFIVKRLIRISHYALPNIIANKPVVPELIQQHATAPNIAHLALAILSKPSLWQEQHATLKALHKALLPERQEMAAQVIVSLLTANLGSADQAITHHS